MSKREFEGYVQVAQLAEQGMVTLRADLAASHIASAVKRVTKTAMPVQGKIRLGATFVGWMSPDEALIVCPDGPATAAALQAELTDHHALVAEVSDARAVFTLKGTAVREVLAKLTPVDVPSVEIGQLRRTRLAQVAAAFWFDAEDRATVVCFSSVADYMFDLLSNAARPGSEVFA